MAQITLTKGLTTEIDEADVELASKYKWCAQEVNNGKHYASTSLKDDSGRTQKVYLHRLLMQPPKGMVVDHIDGNPLNNSRSNLRVCTHSQNLAAATNRKDYKVATTFRGVSYVPKGKKHWRAHVSHNGSCLHLGVYDTEVEAAKARDAKALEVWGEFAVLNFPQEVSGEN